MRRPPIEDKDFWSNAGLRSGRHRLRRPRHHLRQAPRRRTITQQLVRARLLPAWAFEGSTYERKMREIIQSIRLTEAYPGEDGKRQIITAYLNQNFYGNGSYGVQAAAKGYFGKSHEGPDARPVRRSWRPSRSPPPSSTS